MPLSGDQTAEVNRFKGDLQRRFQALPGAFWQRSGDIPLRESMTSSRLPEERSYLLYGQPHTIGEDLVQTVITSQGRVVERLIKLKDDWDTDPTVPVVELGEISDIEYLTLRPIITPRIVGIEKIAARLDYSE